MILVSRKASRSFILLFKFSIYALNKTPQILALLMFPMGIFRMKSRILKDFPKFPLIILFENAHHKLIGSFHELNSVSAFITIYFPDLCCH